MISVFDMGGTIAGAGVPAGGQVEYRAGAIRGEDLFSDDLGKDDLRFSRLTEGEGGLDSKDLSEEHLLALARHAKRELEDDQVQALLITHGTDTVEESAWWLEEILPPEIKKPVVFTCAMRPATVLSSDGAANLRDALCYARSPEAQEMALAGWRVVVVENTSVHAARYVYKAHPYRLPAFSSGEHSPLAWIEEQKVRPAFLPLLNSPQKNQIEGFIDDLPPVQDWPFVAIAVSHAGARAQEIDALVQAGVDGLVIAATGNGTVHSAWESAIESAKASGVEVWSTTRCPQGQIVGSGDSQNNNDGLLFLGGLSPQKLRLSLLLHLLKKSYSTVYVGLGANLGDAPAALKNAICDIDAFPHTKVTAHSSLYISAPIDADGDDYTNAVLECRTALAPLEFLQKLQDLENAAGRQRPYRNAPRPLDLDILLWGEQKIKHTDLIVPHPRMYERAFVLIPLAEIAPQKVSAAQLGAVLGQRVRRMSSECF